MMDYKKASELFEVDETSPSGLRWKVDKGRKVKAGNKAGCKDIDGYWLVRVDRKNYKVHRVIWLLEYGCWPKAELDHKNGAKDLNKIKNLRECDRSENMQNQVVRKDNTSGFMGVSWHARDRVWLAYIGHKGKKHYLGSYNAPEKAHAAYVAAKRQLHTFNPEVRSNGSQLQA